MKTLGRWLGYLRNLTAQVHWSNVVHSSKWFRSPTAIGLYLTFLGILFTPLGEPVLNLLWPPPPHKVLVIGPVTGEASQAWGQFIQEAERVRTEDEEKRPKNGKRFLEFVIENNGGDAAYTLRRLAEVAEDREFLAVIGPATSSVAEVVVREKLDLKGLPLIIPIATNPNLFSQGTRPLEPSENDRASEDQEEKGLDPPKIFRMVPTDKKQVEKIAKEIQKAAGELAVDEVAILREPGNDTYRNYLADGVRQELEKCRGTCPKVKIDAEINGNVVFPRELLEMALIFYVGDQKGAAILHRQAQDHDEDDGMERKRRYFFPDASLANSDIPWASELPEESAMIFSYGCVGRRAKATPGEMEKAKGELPPFVIKSCAGAAPDFGSLGYDAVWLIDEVAGSGDGEGISRKRLMKELRNSTRTLPGVASDYNFDPQGENTLAEFHTFRRIEYEEGRAKWKHCDCSEGTHPEEDSTRSNSAELVNLFDQEKCKETAEEDPPQPEDAP